MSNVLTDEEKQAIIDKYHTDKNYDLWDAFDAIERAVLAKAVDQEAEPIVEVGQHGLSNVFYMIELNRKSLYKGQKLYANPSQSVPEKIKPATRTLESIGYANGWNDCIDSFRKRSDRAIAHPAPQQAIPEGWREIVEAVAHIGVDFGYGKYEIEQDKIEKARELLSASQKV